MNSSDPETAEHHWFPFLRYQKECEAAGKEVSVNEWMRATGQLDEKIAHEESVALAAKISAEKEADAKRAIEKEALEKKAQLKEDEKKIDKKPKINIEQNKTKSKQLQIKSIKKDLFLQPFNNLSFKKYINNNIN